MEWRKVKVLGAGAYGTVHLAVSSLPSSMIAVKSAGVSFAVDSLEREAGVLRHLAGVPNVLRCFGEDESLEDNKPTYNLLLEYAPFGSLQDLIQSVGPMPELTVACYAGMLLRGLAGIHSRGLAHCDLKSANILVFPGPNKYIKQLKIADLGLAKWEAEGYFNENPTWEGSSGKTYYNRGTASTASPESVCGGFHGPPADVWSVGCIIYEMLTGKNVWIHNGNMQYLYDQILHRPIPLPPNLSPTGVNFLKCCLNKDVVSRWSAQRLLNHPFIVENSRGIHLMTHKAPPQPWISTTHMFSKMMIEPPASCYYTNAAISSCCRPQLRTIV